MSRDPIRIDRLIRSRRRTVALQVERDASLVVRVPYFAEEREILRIVEARRTWIAAQQEKARERLRRQPLRTCAEGTTFPFLGDEYPVFFSPELRADLVFEKGFYLREDHRADARGVLESWCRWQARLLLEERSAFFAQKAGVAYRKIRITGARTRWGSCSAGGTLSYTWRLVLAPAEALDYVAAHEVAHLAVRNHSAAFWKKVEEIFPDYLKWKRWLDENGFLLHF